MLVLCVATLAGCAADGRFDRPVASELDASGFGSATAMNQAAMMGRGGSATDVLALRFAREVESTINFAFNSSALSPQAQATLQRQADWIRQFPEVRFSVYGHTDLVGSNASNEALGRARAQAAVAYLVALGVDRSRLRALVSFGETRPVVATQAPERANRRTVTEVSGFVGDGGRPTPLNGKYAQVVFREYIVSAVPPSEIPESQSTIGE
ncbi:OmpA family protein [Salipiger sp. IMCC34102]|nr:OmpA family protein [Salipiger sp. IMCC34102]